MRSAKRSILGTCCICRQAVAGNRIRRHLPRCIEARTGLRPDRNPRKRGRRRIAQKTAHISVRSKERPHWLECCGHLSNFRINGETYSIVVPLPGTGRRFEPEYDYEENLKHMGRTINAAVPPLAKFRHEYDYGTPTELELEYVAVYGELVQAVAPIQPWHGSRIVILARNHPLRACLRCGRPAQWKLVAEYGEYEEYDGELYEEEGVLCEDDLDPITSAATARRRTGTSSR